MNQLANWLQRYGLNDTEIAVYISILENAHCKTADIQRLTGLVRTTIYYSLAELKTKGLLTENLQNNIKTYTVNDPSSLSESIQSRIDKQQSLLGELESVGELYSLMQSVDNKAKESHIARFEGEAAVKQALEQAFRCNSKRWHVIASYDNFLRHTSKEYQQYYLSERKRRGIIAKTLWEPTDTFKAPNLNDIIFRNPRLLSEDFRNNFDSLVILYDDTTLIVQPHRQLTAHSIHDHSSTRLMQLLFMSLWNSAKQ